MTRQASILAAIVVAMTPACGKSSSKRVKPYVKIHTTDFVLNGTTVVVEGERSTIADGGSYSPSWAMVGVPELPAGTPAVTIEVPTPCGTKVLPVTAKIENRFETKLEVKISLGDTPAPELTSTWIDAPAGTEVKIGQSVLAPPTGKLYSLDCAGSHDVSVGGAVVGKVDGTDTSSLFITAKPGTCYRYASIAYGETLHGSGETVWRGEQVYRFSGDIHLFLMNAPDSVQSRTGAGTRRNQIQEIECPP